MKTLKIGLLGLIFFLSGILTHAQLPPEDVPKDRRKEIEAHKVAFITSELKLTSEEAQVFWPVYNECQENMHSFRKENRKKHQREAADGTTTRVKIDEMSDEEVAAMVDNHIIFQQKELDMKKECLALYKEVLPIKKVAKLHQAERKFRQRLLRRINNSDKLQQRGEPQKRRQ